VRNLFTHTPGLEDGALGYLMARDVQSETPIEKALALHIPARVFAPTTDFTDGRIAAYSNWGAALAGLIVEDVSGTPFADYVQKNIFEPLGMKSSTFNQALPPELAAQSSIGYSYEMGAFKPHPFEVINGFEPAGSMSATATDMAKFMIAHLNDGELDGKRILKHETAKLMHARAFSPNPHVNGSGLGFYEGYINGYRLIGHGGDSLYFHSEMMIIPEAKVGLFVSYNTASSLPIDNRGDLLKQFMNRYFPAKLPELKPSKDAMKDLLKYAGSYRENRH
jgi:CubicO group peptidase (beta-lactamase class C family)